MSEENKENKQAEARREPATDTCLGAIVAAAVQSVTSGAPVAVFGPELLLVHAMAAAWAAEHPHEQIEKEQIKLYMQGNHLVIVQHSNNAVSAHLKPCPEAQSTPLAQRPQ